jgi:hypothetical protein
MKNKIQGNKNRRELYESERFFHSWLKGATTNDLKFFMMRQGVGRSFYTERLLKANPNICYIRLDDETEY